VQFVINFVINKQVRWLVVTKVRSESSGWLQSDVTTSACYVISLRLLPSLCNADHIFHRWVWYRTISLRHACTQSSGIILKP